MRERREVTLRNIAELALALDKIQDPAIFLARCAEEIAAAVTPNSFQFVVKEIVKVNGWLAYRIIFGVPADSQRHGVNEAGLLYQPIEKLALTKALNKGEVIAVNNAMKNPLTKYMWEHALHKQIYHLAVLPIIVNHHRWIVVVDKAGKANRTPFSSQEISFLQRCRRVMQKALVAQERTVNHRTKAVCQQGGDMLACLKDLFRNRLSALCLATKILAKKASEKREEDLARMAEMAFRDGKALLEELEQFQDFLHAIAEIEPGNQTIAPLSDVLAIFPFNVVDATTDEAIVITSEELLTLTLARIQRYFKLQETAVKREIKLEEKTIEFIFFSSCFFPRKQKIDLHLLVISNLVELLGGKCEVEHGGMTWTFLRAIK